MIEGEEEEENESLRNYNKQQQRRKSNKKREEGSPGVGSPGRPGIMQINTLMQTQSAPNQMNNKSNAFEFYLTESDLSSTGSGEEEEEV